MPTKTQNTIPPASHNWEGRTPDQAELLAWFHQHCLDLGLTCATVAAKVHLNKTTVYRILCNNYQAADWDKALKKVQAYRRLVQQHLDVGEDTNFVTTSISKTVFSALDFALAEQGITLVVGESRVGKTKSARQWQHRARKGRAAYIEVPPVGGVRSLLIELAKAHGIDPTITTPNLLEAIKLSVTSDNIIIVDEALRLIPRGRAGSSSIETLRHIHDYTGAALALLSTQRFTEKIERSAYQYEQLIGRIGQPLSIPAVISTQDVKAIANQSARLKSDTIDLLTDLANKPGRLGTVVKVIGTAKRIAATQNKKLNDSHIYKSAAIRAQMTGKPTPPADTKMRALA